jgi:hypothetical protein
MIEICSTSDPGTRSDLSGFLSLITRSVLKRGPVIVLKWMLAPGSQGTQVSGRM